MGPTSEPPLDVDALDASELGLLRPLLGRMPFAFAFFDTEARFRQVNQTLADVDGFPVEDHLGRRAGDLLAPGPAGAVERALRAVLESDATAADRELELGGEAPAGSGQRRHWISTWVPARGQDGRLSGVAMLAVEVTGLRRSRDELQEQLEALNEQLSAAAVRTARLQHVTSMLAEAITVDAVARTIVEVAQLAIGADRTAVALYDKPHGQGPLRIFNEDTAAAGGVSPSWSPVETPSVLAHVVREREPFVASSPEELCRQLPGGEIEEFVARTDERAWAGVPLLTSGGALGAIRFSFLRPRTVSGDEDTFLQAVAGQCALAVERAMVYEREHQTANTLQHSLLPGRLPQPPGIVLASRYDPAGAGLRVGGDWYDAFEVPGGRLAIVVGDVMGKGVEAAAGMGRVRIGLRALALRDPEPTAVLSGLDSLFAATEDEEQMTTVLYCLLDMSTGEAVVGNAGHLPPLILSAAGPRRGPAEPGRPLGTRPGSGGPGGRAHQRFHLAAGETAVLFSDGLVENRNRTVEEGLETLVAVAARAPCPVTTGPEAVLDHLFRHMLADHDQDDDVTLLALHVRSDSA